MAFREGLGKTRVSWPFRFNLTQDSVDSFTPLIMMAKFTSRAEELMELGSCTEVMSNRINVFYDLVKYVDRGSIE
jgi:hypothetical protein